jgi:hypothetical protein
MERRVVVEFDLSGVPRQQFRAQECAAEQFAADALRQRWARATVDDVVTTDLKQLPCQRLFVP